MNQSRSCPLESGGTVSDGRAGTVLAGAEAARSRWASSARLVADSPVAGSWVSVIGVPFRRTSVAEVPVGRSAAPATTTDESSGTGDSS
ncbi:hypothetical protein ACWC5I_40500, partial [Kitasatospora sp. NPDC001574]